MYRDLLTITQLMVLPPFVLSFSHFSGIIVLCSAKSPQSCLTLCDLLDHGPLSSPIHGILQARILEWVFPTQGSTHVPYISCIGRWVITRATWEAHEIKSLWMYTVFFLSKKKKMCSDSYANYLGELGQVTLALWTLPSLSIKTNKWKTR